MGSGPGQFVWHELITSDADAALDFYGKVVGWTATDSGQTAMRYDIIHADGVPMGGVMGMPLEFCPGGRPGWLGYVAVEDVDATAERARALGGEIQHGPDEIADVGRFAVIADPQGASIVLFRANPGPEMPAPEMGAPGFVGWNELHSESMEGGFAFYAELFGWLKVQDMPMGELGTYRIFGLGDQWLGGMETKGPNTPRSTWLFYFNVPDINAGGDRVSAAGGKVLFGPTAVPGGQMVQCMDPQGAVFALFAPS